MTSERADRVRSRSCFALADEEPESAGPAQLVLVLTESQLDAEASAAIHIMWSGLANLA
jgi:hypothetical protein